MNVSFAPLEGITGWVYRRAHQRFFPGVSGYYAPFYAPTADSPLSGRGLSDVLPEHNEGVALIPQLLTNKAEDFLAAARLLKELGYEEVNLNLGCPSGTVVAKKKGSGFLGLTEELDRFFDGVFSDAEMKVSVKTRIGLDSPDEWPALLEIFDRYPIHELTVHPRIRRDAYRGQPRMEAFRYALEHTNLPLCYNGDLNAPADFEAFGEQYPNISHVMAGRGLVANPALVRQIQGGPPLQKKELQDFLSCLTEEYRAVLYGDRPVLGKLKELWFYLACQFPEPEKYMKRIRKAKTLVEYQDAANALFRDRDLRPDGYFSGD